LADDFAIQLAAIGRYGVVPRGSVRALLQEQKKESYRPCFDEACQIELGKALAAQKTLAPRIMRAGKRCRLAATLEDLTPEVTESPAAIEVECKEEALLDGVDRVVAQLVKKSS